MLALAWSGPSGAMAACTLMDLTGDELSRLAQSKAIRSQDCVNAQDALNELLDVDEEGKLNAIRQALSDEFFSWDRVCEEATLIAETAEREQEYSAEERHSALSAFADEIGQLVSAWWGFAGGASGSVQQLGMRAKQHGVQRFLEEYALVHGKLPDGPQRVAAAIMQTRLDFSLDVGALRAYSKARKPK